MRHFKRGCTSTAGIATIGCLLLLSISIPALAIDLKTAAQQSAPKYMTLDSGEIGGVCVDIMQALEMADSELNFLGYRSFLPFKRLQRQLELGKLDVFFGFKRTPKREQMFTFIDTPLYQVNYVIAVRNDDPVELESLEDLKAQENDGALATVKGSAAGRFLDEVESLPARSDVSTPTQLLKILRAGRIRYAFYHDLGLQDIIEREDIGDDLRILPVSFSTYYHHVAFSRDVPAATIARVSAALNAIIASGKLAQIQRKYKVHGD